MEIEETNNKQRINKFVDDSIYEEDSFDEINIENPQKIVCDVSESESSEEVNDFESIEWENFVQSGNFAEIKKTDGFSKVDIIGKSG